MTPIARIRQEVFKVPQAAFADIAGTTQPTVSRWENGELAPGAIEMGRIREAAREQGLQWDDRWFFEVAS